jgi:hypothetical protein
VKVFDTNRDGIIATHDVCVRYHSRQDAMPIAESHTMFKMIAKEPTVSCTLLRGKGLYLDATHRQYMHAEALCKVEDYYMNGRGLPEGSHVETNPHLGQEYRAHLKWLRGLIDDQDNVAEDVDPGPPLAREIFIRTTNNILYEEIAKCGGPRALLDKEVGDFEKTLAQILEILREALNVQMQVITEVEKDGLWEHLYDFAVEASGDGHKKVTEALKRVSGASSFDFLWLSDLVASPPDV